MNPKTVTLLSVDISSSAHIKALLLETPASLTLQTPSAAVQIRMENFRHADTWMLREIRSSD